MEKNYLTAEEAARYLGLSSSYLAKLRMGGNAVLGPRFIRIGPRAVRYRLADLDRWMDQRAVCAGSK